MDRRLNDFYDDHLREYGPNSPQALAWRGDNSQILRFNVLSQIGDLHGKSVLDEGCGLGDLYGYLESQGIHTTYKGIDINEQLIGAGREKYPGINLECVDFSDYSGEAVDYVLSSDALTFAIPNAKEIYFEHMRKMFELSKIGCAFNLLDASFWNGDGTYVTWDYSEVLAFCSQLTSKIQARRDYSVEDITFYLYH